MSGFETYNEKGALLTGSPAGEPAGAQRMVYGFHYESGGVAGGTTVANTWTVVPINALGVFGFPNVSLSSNRITVPAGDIPEGVNFFYEFGTILHAGSLWRGRVRLQWNSGNSSPIMGYPVRGAVSNALMVVGKGASSYSGNDLSLLLEYQIDVAQATSGLGLSAPDGDTNFYAYIKATPIEG